MALKALFDEEWAAVTTLLLARDANLKDGTPIDPQIEANGVEAGSALVMWDQLASGGLSDETMATWENSDFQITFDLKARVSLTIEVIWECEPGVTYSLTVDLRPLPAL